MVAVPYPRNPLPAYMLGTPLSFAGSTPHHDQPTKPNPNQPPGIPEIQRVQLAELALQLAALRERTSVVARGAGYGAIEDILLDHFLSSVTQFYATASRAPCDVRIK